MPSHPTHTMAVSSSERVLVIPELLFHILSFLIHFPSSLLSAILVNHQWFECGIKLLWGYPSHTSLLNVAKDRRQIYASHTRYLQLPCMSKGKYGELAGLDFSKLDSLWLVDGCCYNEHVGGFMSKSLKTIFLIDAPLTSTFLDCIASRCTDLSKITFCRSTSDTAASFIKFLRSCSSLNHLELVDVNPPKTGNKILRYVGSHCNLRSLLFYSTNGPLKKALFDAILNTTPSPFRDLDYFRVTILPDAIPSLVKCIKSIQTLEVFCRGETNGNLRYFSTLSTLRRLDIMLPESAVPSALEITPLKRLALLEDLSLRCYDEVWADISSDFDQSSLDTLLSGLSNLRRLELGFPCDISPDAMAILSKRCPQLERCEISGIIWTDLDRNLPPYNEAEGAMFPHLTKLTVGLFLDPVVHNNPTRRSAARFALRLHKQCPNLRLFKYLAPVSEWHEIFGNTVDELVDRKSPRRDSDSHHCSHCCNHVHGVDNPFG